MPVLARNLVVGPDSCHMGFMVLPNLGRAVTPRAPEWIEEDLVRLADVIIDESRV